MKKDNSKNIILDYQDVENKIKRISLEILEDNIDQKNLILFGVSKNGKIIAKKIIASIKKHSEIDLELIGVEIDINSNNVLKFDKIFKVNNRSLIIVKTPVYVAGFDLGVLPIGFWSISITLSKYSIPLIDSCERGYALALLSSFESAG